MDSVANITNGFAFKSAEFNNRKDGVPLIRIRDVLKGSTSTYYSGQIPEGYWVYPEDLIVGMDGDFNTTIWRSEPALLNQRVCKIEVQEDKYNKRFFYHALPGYLSAINANTSSVTVKHLSSRTLQDTLLPLPPLAEQKIIAEKLDTLLAQVESTKARLEQIPQILKRFRQAVLGAAVSGKLTEDWRDNSSLSGWIEGKLGEFIKKPSYGTSSKSNKEGLIPVLRMGNLQGGKLDWTDLVYTSDTIEIEKYKLEYNDVLFNRTNSPELVGKTAIYKSEQPAIYAGYLIRVQCLPDLNPDYLNYHLNSILGRQYCYSVKSDGVSQSNINAQKLIAYPITVPPLPEQHEIVRRVEQLFAYADTIEKQVNNALARVNNLTQSILAKAFRGELTAQWRAENPELISGENSAAALLEKIKAERAASGGKKASRKKS